MLAVAFVYIVVFFPIGKTNDRIDKASFQNLLHVLMDWINILRMICCTPFPTLKNQLIQDEVQNGRGVVSRCSKPLLYLKQQHSTPSSQEL